MRSWGTRVFRPSRMALGYWGHQFPLGRTTEFGDVEVENRPHAMPELHSWGFRLAGLPLVIIQFLDGFPTKYSPAIFLGSRSE